MSLAEILFHCKIDQSEYSIKLEGHSKKPQIVDKGTSKTMLNEFFFCIFKFSKVSSWQSMKDIEVHTMDDVDELFLVRNPEFCLSDPRSGPVSP